MSVKVVGDFSGDGLARTLYTRMIPGVSVRNEAGATAVANAKTRLTLRCSARVADLMAESTYQPVSGLPDDLVSVLSSHSLAVRGRTAAAAGVAAVHAAQNGIHNGGSPYDVETLRSWQDDARRLRLPPVGSVINHGTPFRPARSFDVDDSKHCDASESDVATLVERFYHHLEPPYSSAGALYPVHVVGEFMGRGVCQANAPGFEAQWNAMATSSRNVEDPALARTAARIWFTLDLDRASQKYGSRSYRYGLIETGAAATYLEHVAASLGIDTRPFGGFDDDEVAHRLGAHRGVLIAHCLGLRRSEETDVAAAVSVQVMRVKTETVHLATAWEGGEVGSGPLLRRIDGAIVPERVVGQAFDSDASLAMAKATSELTERIAFIRNPQLSTTNGMAAHPVHSQARLNACLELYERHCLMLRWFNQAPPDLLDPPDNALARILASIAANRHLDVHYGGLTDPEWGIPAAVVLTRSTRSGAVLIGTAAAPDLAHAVRSATQEVLKSLMHRIGRVPAAASVFEPHRISASEVEAAYDHESYFANDEVPRSDTDVLVPVGRFGGPKSADPRAIDRLVETATIDDLASVRSSGRRHVVSATHPLLVPVKFGQCSKAYRATIVSLLDVDPLPHWPHPLG